MWLRIAIILNLNLNDIFNNNFEYEQNYNNNFGSIDDYKNYKNYNFEYQQWLRTNNLNKNCNNNSGYWQELK
jgi:hypothetical protein